MVNLLGIYICIVKACCLFLIYLSCYISAYGQSVRRCNTNQAVTETSHSGNFSFPREGIEIPVVFHIVWNRPDQNISDDFIFSQLEVLNDDYNADNADLSMLPSEFKNVQGNPGISFCLANKNPKGRPAIGIIRTNTSQVNIGSQRQIVDGRRRIKSTELGGSDPWNT